MKLRTDFVTNSSSSSFIVSVKNDEAHQPFIAAIIDCCDNMDTCTGKKITTVDELKEYVMHNYAYSGETLQDVLNKHWVSCWFHAANQALKSGKIIIYKDVDYGAAALTSFVETMVRMDPDINILYNE